MITPENIEENDAIGILSPGYSIDSKHIENMVKIISNLGFRPIVGDNALKKLGSLAGSDKERASDLQNMIDNDNIKAIICSRGGYGCVRIIDKIDFTNFIKKPKWLIGFSDVTCFHNYINSTLEIETIHSDMGINFSDKNTDTTENIFKIAMGSNIGQQLVSQKHYPNKIDQEFEGEIVGGNLSVILGLRGTIFDVNFNNKILLIEDVGEKLYNIDRMLNNLRLTNNIRNLRGIIFGHFTDITNENPVFPFSLSEIIYSNFKNMGIPIITNICSGHDFPNIPIVLGRKTKVSISNNNLNIIQYGK